MKRSPAETRKPLTRSPRTWRRDPAGRRERILAAAAREFGRRGFAQARLDRVARTARVAEGTVYHQFGSKTGLLQALGERYGEGLAAAAFGRLSPASTPDDVSLIVSGIFDYVASSPAPLVAFLLSHGTVEGGIAQDANRRRMLGAIEEVLAGWLRRGAIARLDVGITAELQFGLVETGLRDCFLRHGGERRAAYVEEVTRCLRATLPPPGSGGEGWRRATGSTS